MLVTVRALLSTNSKSTDPAKYHWLTREFFHGLLVWHLPAALWVLCLTATADLLCESLLRCALHTHVATTSDMPPIDHLSHYFEVSSVLEPSVRRYLSIAIILWPHSCLNSQLTTTSIVLYLERTLILNCRLSSQLLNNTGFEQHVSSPLLCYSLYVFLHDLSDPSNPFEFSDLTGLAPCRSELMAQGPKLKRTENWSLIYSPACKSSWRAGLIPPFPLFPHPGSVWDLIKCV